MPAPFPNPDTWPALSLAATRAARIAADGTAAILTLAEAAAARQREPHLLCHTAAVARRLHMPAARWQRDHADLLDLFAFAMPGRLTLPSPAGLARALGLAAPVDLAAEPATLLEARAALLAQLAALPLAARARAAAIAAVMGGAWAWGSDVAAALGTAAPDRRSLSVWAHLPEWEEPPPRGQPGSLPVAAAEAQGALALLLGAGREERPSQSAYAALAAEAFAPRDQADAPRVVLAEAGTGTGKTAGYLAPARLWAERNRGAVWVSTYTKNLQRQIDQELARVYPEPRERAEKVALRKGRENYLCLLNYQEAAGRAGVLAGRLEVVLGLVARWIGATRDGDLAGGDFPPWLAAEAQALGLTDRRGECVYSACPHYRICFIERNVRKARAADIVIANHALVMAQAVRDGPEADSATTREGRTRFVFDEGHQLFAAADSTFAAHLTAREGADLRRWLRGREGVEAARGRGLAERLSDLLSDDAALALIDTAVAAARHLPGPGWGERLLGGTPRGAMEQLLALIRAQVLARSAGADADYDLECAVLPLIDGVAEAGQALAGALGQLGAALAGLGAALTARLEADAATLDTPTRARIEALARGLLWRLQSLVAPWRAMAATLGAPAPEGFIDWFGIARMAGRESDCGMYRHWIDPTIPFAAAVLRPAHGVLITSASLCDRPPAEDQGEPDWRSAEARTGAQHLALPPRRGAFSSPFDYAAQARVFIVKDVAPRDIGALAAAVRALFLASGGGALGLFTAVRTLRAVHGRIAAPLEAAGLRLLAQHVDPYDMGLLIDMFRAEEDSCLLGTDAARDGVDVPGASLRLVVFDRVPWPRPDLLFQARKARFGGSAYVDMTTRFRLTQAFGRLIRRNEDRGVFVVLDARCPSRLLSGLPAAVPVARCGLAEAVAATGRFLGRAALPGP